MTSQSQGCCSKAPSYLSKDRKGDLTLPSNSVSSNSVEQNEGTDSLLLQVVQGYKFNIFYPDLIEKLEAPTYSLEKDPGADEHGSTCMLR